MHAWKKMLSSEITVKVILCDSYHHHSYDYMYEFMPHILHAVSISVTEPTYKGQEQVTK